MQQGLLRAGDMDGEQGVSMCLVTVTNISFRQIHLANIKLNGRGPGYWLSDPASISRWENQTTGSQVRRLRG